MSISILADEDPARNSIVGAWKAEPILSQLGLIQTSYIFNSDDSYSYKINYLSVCRPHFGQNCEYAWDIDEGKYSVNNAVLTLYDRTLSKVKLEKGGSKPELLSSYRIRKIKEYGIKLDGETLVITKKRGKPKTTVFKRFVPIGEDEKAPSDEQMLKYYRDAK